MLDYRSCSRLKFLEEIKRCLENALFLTLGVNAFEVAKGQLDSLSQSTLLNYGAATKD